MYSLIDQNAWWDSVDALRKPMSLWVKSIRYLDEVMGVLLASFLLAAAGGYYNAITVERDYRYPWLSGVESGIESLFKPRLHLDYAK